MADSRLAPVDPSDYRYAVHSCGYKWDLTCLPDRAVALFADSAAAIRFGQSMWPSTCEVIDITTGERVCA
ncbi:hypothetical protein [Pseudomonas koreensis]|uniref:hypothetical protein n=1 Tax=Pseudomonas koreensis TaxID=198620 RepID=UPI001330B8F2|nr:hypothetical protein [Pseudomonas koreensis]